MNIKGNFKCKVRAPAKTVYKYAATIQNLSIWRLHAVDARAEKDGVEVMSEGDRYVVSYRKYSKQFEERFQVERTIEGEVLRSRLLSHSMNFQEELRLTEQGRNTEIEYILSINSTGFLSAVQLALIGWANGFHLRKMAKRNALRLATGIEVRPASEQAGDE